MSAEYTCSACHCHLVVTAGPPLVTCAECVVHATMRREMVKPRVLEDGTREYGEVARPTRIPSGYCISSVRVVPERGDVHESVVVWNRGGLAGELVVMMGDGDEIARRLITTTLTEHSEADSAFGEMRELIVLLATRDVSPCSDAVRVIQADCKLLAERQGWLK